MQMRVKISERYLAGVTREYIAKSRHFRSWYGLPVRSKGERHEVGILEKDRDLSLCSEGGYGGGRFFLFAQKSRILAAQPLCKFRILSEF